MTRRTSGPSGENSKLILVPVQRNLLKSGRWCGMYSFPDTFTSKASTGETVLVCGASRGGTPCVRGSARMDLGLSARQRGHAAGIRGSLAGRGSGGTLGAGNRGNAGLSTISASHADPFEHPDAQRRFRTVHNVEELERALVYPWEKWTVFLHPIQRELIEKDYNGPVRISGSAGTGKTVVALHRAVHLARKHPDARILLTTFSETLARLLAD